MKAKVIMATLAAALVSAPAASAMQFTVHTDGLVPAANLHAMERAVSYQVDRQVARYYPVTPVSFVAHSPNVITFESAAAVRRVTCAGMPRPCTPGAGFHGPATAADGTTIYPIGIASGQLSVMQLEFSHEIVETEVDPDLTGTEICDPVESEYYIVKGVMVSAWVLPDGQPFMRASGLG